MTMESAFAFDWNEVYMFDGIDDEEDRVIPLQASIERTFQIIREGKMCVDAREPEYNTTLLMCACRFRMLDVVDQLLAMGADVNTSDQEGTTPLWYALQPMLYRDNVHVVRTLLRAGANVTVRNRNGEVPLLRVCNLEPETTRIEVVGLLLKHGADARAIDGNGRSALSVCFGPRELHELLYNAGADVNAVDGRGDSPLQRACESGDVDFVLWLLHRGADVGYVNGQGSCLHAAVSSSRRSNKLQMLRALFDYGAHSVLEAPDRRGRTALHWSVIAEDVLMFLLRNGADVHCDGEEGTPLHLAVRFGCATSMRILLEHGADLYSKDSRGHTVVDVFFEVGGAQITIAMVLAAHGAISC